MSLDNNFYEWLGLPVETYEYNFNELEKQVEKYITNCNSGNNTKLQNRASLYGNDMRNAIADPNEWKKQYSEYQKKIITKISNAIEMCADNQEISAGNIEQISKNNHVGEQYVIDIAKGKGYEISSTSSGNKSSVKKQKYSFNDLAPSSKNILFTPQKLIEELGYRDVAELVFIGQQSIDSCKIDELISQLEILKKKWKNVSVGVKAQQKSNYDKICSGMISFFKQHSIREYIDFLLWNSVKKLLDDTQSELKTLNQGSLNKKIFNLKVEAIYELVGDKEKAEGILESYCDEKGISYPKEMPNVAVCPFCMNDFVKSAKVQELCPSCNSSFLVECPKCHSTKNILVDDKCCGVDIRIYPLMLKRLDEANEMLKSLSMEAARVKINEINEKWPGLPGLAETQKEYSRLNASYESDIKALQKCYENNEFFKAKGICEKIGGTYPKFKASHTYVYSQVENAEKLFKEYAAKNNIDEKINLLLDITSEISDYTQANTELKKYPIENITDLEAKIDNEFGEVNISWKSGNRTNSVNYIVRRSANSQLANTAFGEELVSTNSLAYKDTEIAEGTFYYYGVYAQRGTMVSKLSAMQTPVVYLKSVNISIRAVSKMVSITWNTTNSKIKVYYSENPITSYGEGKECLVVTPSGCDIEGLENGRNYYFAVYKIAAKDGREYHSEASFGEATPMVEVAYPQITKSLGTQDGEYIITHLNKEKNLDIQFYHSTAKIRAFENSTISLSELQSKLQKYSFDYMGENKYSLIFKNSSVDYIYPVVIRENIATIGNILSLRYIKSIKILSTIISANDICITIEEWPQGAESLQICYSNDAYPQDIKDCDIRLPAVSKKQYEQEKLLIIRNVKTQPYYISIFARINADSIPVSNCYINNSTPTKIEYSFSANVFGAIKITLSNSFESRPELYFCVNPLSAPLTKEEGTLVYTIPASDNVKKKEVISVPNYTAKKGEYGKLFSSDKNCDLLASGGLQLK